MFCTHPMRSPAPTPSLAILAHRFLRQSMLPPIAILARSDRPVCLQLSPSSRARRHLLTSQSRVVMLLPMLLLPICPLQCRLRHLQINFQASLRSSLQLRVAPPCPSMRTSTHQIVEFLELPNTKCQCLQIRSPNSVLEVAMRRLRTPGAKTAAPNTQSSTSKS